MIKDLRYILICLFIFGIISTSCNSKKEISLVETDENTDIFIVDSTKIFIDGYKVDSMIVILDNDVKKHIDTSDHTPLIQVLSVAEYDLRLNSGDIMIKMQAPDYSVIIYNKGRSSDDNDWLMVWNENGRIKFNEHWYYITEDKKPILGKLLDKYK